MLDFGITAGIGMVVVRFSQAPDFIFPESGLGTHRRFHNGITSGRLAEVLAGVCLVGGLPYYYRPDSGSFFDG